MVTCSSAFRDTRVIPVLLLHGTGLYKTVRFRKRLYIGDPVNAVRIFSDMEVDELAVLDIGAAAARSKPQWGLLADIASEAFMPAAYGGGLDSLPAIERVLRVGFEKVVLNTVAHSNSELIRAASREFGAQSVIVSIDAKRNMLSGYRILTHGGRRRLNWTPVEAAVRAVDAGAGELLVTSIQREGTLTGYDCELIRQVAAAVNVPVIAHGGARSLADFRAAVELGGASAVAAGSLFVLYGPHRAVLISYPTQEELGAALAGTNGRI